MQNRAYISAPRQVLFFGVRPPGAEVWKRWVAWTKKLYGICGVAVRLPVGGKRCCRLVRQ